MSTRLSSSRLQTLLRGLASADASGLPALEGDGSLQREHELVFFAKLLRPEQLQQAASSEHHEQWEIRPPRLTDRRYFGSIRVRKTTRTTDEGKQVQYELTLKTVDTHSDSAGKDEVELDVTEAVFDSFKRICTAGMIKTRYCFPVEYKGHALTWEVDVYTGPDGQPVPWCKLDLELPEHLDGYPPFPVELGEVFDVQPKDRTAEQRAFVDRLMQDYFLQTNPYPSSPEQQVTTTESLLNVQ